MRLSKLIPFLMILLLPVCAYAEKGIGYGMKFDVNTAELPYGLIAYVSAFGSHVRAFANASYGEDLNSADKQWDAGLGILYVPEPLKTLGLYMELDGSAQWLDTEQGIENYARGAVGLGGVYQFSPVKDNNTGLVTGHKYSLYLGYRAKAQGTNTMTHEIVARWVVAL